MAAPLLERIRSAVLTQRYVMTAHAEEEMDNDALTVFDVENALLTGRVVNRQRDRRTGERKCVVRGEAVHGWGHVAVACKFGPTGRLVVLTVYAD